MERKMDKKTMECTGGSRGIKTREVCSEGEKNIKEENRTIRARSKRKDPKSEKEK